MTRIQIDPAVVADAVFLALRAGKERGDEVLREFHRERDALYAARSAERSETLFAAHDAEWFHRLRLSEPLLRALAQVPRVVDAVDLLIVRRGLRSKDEGSELYRGEQTRLVLTLLPLRFADPEKLVEIALRELAYCDDMLDPEFEYEPQIPRCAGLDPVRAELARDRFRVLWEARIRGRLSRAGTDRTSLGRTPLGRMPERFARAFAAAISARASTLLYRDATSGRLSTAGALWSCALDPSSRESSTALDGANEESRSE